MPYTNPILPGSNPDPSIIRIGTDFFLTTSTFEYTPAAPIYHSTDLIKWKLIGHALTRPSQLTIQTPEPGGGVWATTLRYHDGVFYITAASFTRYRPQDDDRVWPRGFVVSTRDIWDEESWSEPVWFDAVGFDQDLFFDDDGTVYLSSTYRTHSRTLTETGEPANLKDFAIHICTIDLESGITTSAPKLIRSSRSGVSEGSHIFKRNGIYYLFTAEGGTESGHSEWVFRSYESPFGPWESAPHNPILTSGVGKDDEVQNTGHADLVEDNDGNWWAVLLAVRPVWRDEQGKGEGRWEGSVFGRETFLVPVDWVNDWPVVNAESKGKVTLTVDTPHLYQHREPLSWRDDFTSDKLQIGWYRKNTPLKKDYTLTGNCLRLHGAPYTLSTPATPTLFLRKQTERFCTWETRLSFFPDSMHTEAGTVVYLNYFTHVSIGIQLDPAVAGTSERDPRIARRRVIRFTATNILQGGSTTTTTTISSPLASNISDVVLQIQCGDSYRFGFREVHAGLGEGIDPDHPSWVPVRESENNTTITWLGEVSNRALVEAPLPVGAPFTGVMLGLYSCGDREAVRVGADFEYVEVRGVEGEEE